MNGTLVSILMGSKSDLPVVQACLDTLKKLQIRYDVRVLSAHRTPEEVVAYVKKQEALGVQVFIAAAGCAAHLAGAIAAQTVLPVIGIPLAGSDLLGLDALLSTVQMPKGIPVATVAIGKAGAINAANLAAQIIGISDKELQERLRENRKIAAEEIMAIEIEE